jgi:4-amino-4-deoxy-L-arabinose transferase-like glycosyltransferase
MTPYLFGQPQFEKPILLYWLMRFGFIIFGITGFSARFFPALFAILGVIAVYLLARVAFKEEQKAFLAGLVSMSYGLYVGLARTVFTDMIFCVLILFSLVSFFWAWSGARHKRLGIVLSFIFSGLAVLAKGPLGFLLAFAVIFLFLLWRRDIKYAFSKDFFFGAIIFLAIALPWYIFMVKEYGDSFSREFFYNDHWRRLIEAEHKANDTWYFYPVAMLGCMFPWSVYVAAALGYLFWKLKHKPEAAHLFLASWIVAVLLTFQFAHSKLVSYIFPLFPALSIITADFISDFAAAKNRRPLRIASYLSGMILFLIPVGLLVSSRIFSSYVPSPAPLYFLALLLLAQAIVFLIFCLKDKFIRAAYTLMLSIILIMAFVPLVAKDAGPYISSKGACDYLLKNYDPQGTLLVSKFFARGVRYFTERDVAVIDINGQNYFSPHPIPFFSTMEEVKNFLRRQGLTYAVLKKSGWVRLEDLPPEEFKFSLLKMIGDAYLVKLEVKRR